jgi:hypothetical protein
MLLSESCGLVSLGALSDEKTGLQFAVQSLNGPSRPEPVSILYCPIWDSPNMEGQLYTQAPGFNLFQYIQIRFIPDRNHITSSKQIPTG